MSTTIRQESIHRIIHHGISDTHAELMVTTIMDYLSQQYLAIHNTCERTYDNMIRYMVQRTLERYHSSITVDQYSRMILSEPWEWNPSQWSHAIRTDTSEQLVAVPRDKGTPTDQFLCGKCGQRKCIFSTAQTRASDEGMTTFVTCLHCGKTWKM